MGDYDLWDTPLTCAYMLWRFTKAFESKKGSGPNLLLAFPALTILMTPELSAPLSSKGVFTISDYAFHFIEKCDTTLAQLQELILEKRELVRLSISVSIASALLVITKNGELHANAGPTRSSKATKFRESCEQPTKRLGEIFASTPPEKIGYYLGVNF